jgi:hypothetical protein
LVIDVNLVPAAGVEIYTYPIVYIGYLK